MKPLISETRSFLLFSITALALIFASTVNAQQSTVRERSIKLIDLGTLGGNNSGAMSVDDSGQVVGWSLLPSGNRSGFTSCEGCTMQDLGTLIGGSDSIATAVSNNGQWLAGHSGINAYGPSFSQFTQGFVINEGVRSAVGALYCPCTFNNRYGISEADGVNDLGTVVGWSPSPRANYYHAFIWKDGVIEDLSDTGTADPSYSRALGINNAQQVVGYIARDDALTYMESNRVAFIWEDGLFTYLDHLTGYSNSTAAAINQGGQVAGWSGNADYTDTTAALWSEAGVSSIGKLEGDTNSRALAINDSRQVVGWSTNAEHLSRAFMWQEGYLLDLNSLLPADSDWQLVEARDINNSGMIVGTGLKNFELRAFLLIPPSIQRLESSARTAVPPRERGRGRGVR